MQNTQEWLREKIASYKENPEEALESMLIKTNEAIEQYINSPGKAQAGVLEACCTHNKLFFEAVFPQE